MIVYIEKSKHSLFFAQYKNFAAVIFSNLVFLTTWVKRKSTNSPISHHVTLVLLWPCLLYDTIIFCSTYRLSMFSHVWESCLKRDCELTTSWETRSSSTNTTPHHTGNILRLKKHTPPLCQLIPAVLRHREWFGLGFTLVEVLSCSPRGWRFQVFFYCM